MKLFEGVLGLKRAVWAFFRLLTEPLLSLWRWSVRYMIAPLYRFYFWGMKHLKRTFRISRNRLLYPFSTRYILHGVIIIITLFVSANSLYASEVDREFVASRSLIATILGNEEVEIVERASDQSTATSAFREEQAAVSSTTAINSELNHEETELAYSQGTGSLVKPNTLATEIGERPRSEVEFYTVEGGDTVSGIAETFGVTTDTILWENQLRDTDVIKEGQKLTILPQTGVSVQVQEGDTLDTIANKYKVDVEDIVEYNKLASAEAIKAEQIILIPGAEVPELAPPAPPTRYASGGTSGGYVPPPAQVTGSWTWPTTCRRINQYFKWRHSGIDIDDCGAGVNATVFAARGGRVESVGWGGGYGYNVVINHGDGIKTLYAHFAKVYVSAGQQVGAGASIGGQGCTGWCTGTHVHFEIIIGGRKVNPLSYL